MGKGQSCEEEEEEVVERHVALLRLSLVVRASEREQVVPGAPSMTKMLLWGISFLQRSSGLAEITH
jgi:hypothetical protein